MFKLEQPTSIKLNLLMILLNLLPSGYAEPHHFLPDDNRASDAEITGIVLGFIVLALIATYCCKIGTGTCCQSNSASEEQQPINLRPLT